MTFADQMIAKLQELLLTNAGLKQVTIDGTTVAYDDLAKQLAYWEGQAARANGNRPRSAQINLNQ